MANVISTNTQNLEEESNPKETVIRVNFLLKRTTLDHYTFPTHPSPKPTFCPKWEVLKC